MTLESAVRLRLPLPDTVAFLAALGAILIAAMLLRMVHDVSPTTVALEILLKGSTLNRFLEEVRDAAIQVVPLGESES